MFRSRSYHKSVKAMYIFIQISFLHDFLDVYPRWTSETSQGMSKATCRLQDFENICVAVQLTPQDIICHLRPGVLKRLFHL